VPKARSQAEAFIGTLRHAVAGRRFVLFRRGTCQNVAPRTDFWPPDWVMTYLNTSVISRAFREIRHPRARVPLALGMQ
jgi:hypothetical protein